MAKKCGVAIMAAWVCVGSEGDCSDSSRYFVRHVARDGHAKALAELFEALGVSAEAVR